MIPEIITDLQTHVRRSKCQGLEKETVIACINTDLEIYTEELFPQAGKMTQLVKALTVKP